MTIKNEKEIREILSIEPFCKICPVFGRLVAMGGVDEKTAEKGREIVNEKLIALSPYLAQVPEWEGVVEVGEVDILGETSITIPTELAIGKCRIQIFKE